MNPQVQIWMPAILALFGTLIVVLFSAGLNTRSLSAQIDGLRGELNAKLDTVRAEMKQGFAELRLEFHTDMSELSNRVERLEERRGLVRP